jgi:hypothetical protein
MAADAGRWNAGISLGDGRILKPIDETATLYYDVNRKSTCNLVACGAFSSFTEKMGDRGRCGYYI